MAIEILHLAVIMDGNRRWAKQRGLPSIEGHRAGVGALKNLVKLCPDYGIKYLTVYAFSTENWKRDSNELSFLFSLLAEVAIKELKALCEANIRVSFIGDLSAFTDQKVRGSLEQLAESTEKNTGLNLQIALNYGAIDEFVYALERIRSELSSEEIENLTEVDFSRFLYTKNIPDPDILLRTGGESRLSNYLLWQSANSQLAFIDTLWPDFSETHLREVLADYGAATPA